MASSRALAWRCAGCPHHACMAQTPAWGLLAGLPERGFYAPGLIADMVQGEAADWWWQKVDMASPHNCLGPVACLLLSMVPHAADPEGAISFMGLTETPLRSRMLTETTSAVSTVRQYLRVSPPEDL